ncbi:MAG: thioredoxin family protein [Opitutales bacterium]|nr:thioredoxin family protein [Opitutales bacterium]
MRRITSVIALLSAFAAAFAEEPSYGPQTDQHVTAELVAETTTLRPGETARVGLRLAHEDKWHTYWKITATGYSPSLRWELPDDFEAGEIQWTVPRPYESLGYVEYVYEDEVLLPVEIRVPENAEPGSEVILRARAEWLMCTDTTCIPGGVDLALALTVEDGASAPDPDRADLFAAADRHLPRSHPDVTATAWQDDDAYFLLIESAGDVLPEELYFFDANLLLKPTLTQEADFLDEHRALLAFAVDPAGGTGDRFEGVLAALSGEWTVDGRALAGITIDTPLGTEPPDERLAAAGTRLTPAGAEPSAPPVNFAVVAALAFLGGLILNLMPCVFPIIGIKVMGFVNQAGSDPKSVVLHGVTFTLGILLSFWVLAGFLMALRAGGEQLGWGFQLQSPVFNYALIIIFLLFALNLSGVFEIGQSAMSVGDGLTRKSGYSGSFFSGILATVVATPCSAPVLGSALGALMAMPPTQQFLAFTAMALGLASPYLVLSIFPKLMAFLPKPGPWMESFKQGMAFLLYAAVAYLIWVLAGQLVGSNGYADTALLKTFTGLVLIATAAWVYGRWGAAFRAKGVRRAGYAIAALFFAGGFAAGYPTPFATDLEDAPMVVWEDWEPGKAERLVEEGKVVYVDFTARWCVTCQSNKAVVFGSSEVRRRFHEMEVVTLQADWTNHDPRITEALREFGRTAIPVNLFYAPGLDEPLILPELLTPGIVLDRLERVADS